MNLKIANCNIQGKIRSGGKALGNSYDSKSGTSYVPQKPIKKDRQIMPFQAIIGGRKFDLTRREKGEGFLSGLRNTYKLLNWKGKRPTQKTKVFG